LDAAMSGIYVERTIRTDLERLWTYTQSPHLHERWDLRFSKITYLPRTLDGPLRCRYIKFLGVGLRASGVGETTGIVHNENGSRTTKISFWHEGGLAPIEAGTGYWRYVPTHDGVRFISYFDYELRFGILGKFIDVLFRPLFGWATARSVDTLALWLEDGIEPERGWLRAKASRCARTPSAISESDRKRARA
jgi:hypothetical protein